MDELDFPRYVVSFDIVPEESPTEFNHQTWLDQHQVPAMPTIPPMSSFAGIGPSPLGGQQLRPDNFNADADEELIPTAIVIKNIPFAVKKEQLVELMTHMNLPLPYAFNYHFDNGVFRGLAFANFTSSEETATVIEHLNHFDLQGRKLRVEYKKMLPLQERERIEREKRERRGQLEEQHRPMATGSNSQLRNQPSMSSLSSHVPATSPSPVTVWNSHGKRSKTLDPTQLTQNLSGLDLNDPSTLDTYSKLLLFRDDPNRESLIFPTHLTPQERRGVHTLAHHMGLAHISRGLAEHRQVHVHKTGNNLSPPIPQVSAIQSAEAAKRELNRAATYDFGERNVEPRNYNTLRGQQSSGFLGIPDSPGGFVTAQNLRGVKSFADLRSCSPSPVPSTASFPATLQSNVSRFQEYGPGSASSSTPTLTPAISSTALGHNRDENFLVNGLGNMSLKGGGGLGPGGPSGPSGLGGPNESPRRLRGMFSWEQDPQGQQQQQQQHSAGGPIGSNRSFSVNYDDPSRDRGQNMPLRQPRGPINDRGTGFSRGRQNGHQGRGSDELRAPPNVEIIVE